MQAQNLRYTYAHISDNMKKNDENSREIQPSRIFLLSRERAECTNSFTTICSHTLTKISLVFLFFSLQFLSSCLPLLLLLHFFISHFPFSNHLCFDPLSLPFNIEPLNLLDIYLYTLVF